LSRLTMDGTGTHIRDSALFSLCGVFSVNPILRRLATLVCVEGTTGQRQKMSRHRPSKTARPSRHDVWPVLSLDLYACEDVGMVEVMAAMLVAAEAATSGKVGVKASSPNEWARLTWSARLVYPLHIIIILPR
jgi:hypothetical protein